METALRWLDRRHHGLLFEPVIDPMTDRRLRARYLAGQISIGAYLDRRFGTAFAPTAERGAAR